ncbi:MAG: hypothetical protein KAS32_13855 [Candidatus Peribacteraceae bacterium]|nr:hypothetical protein [Candidatus Peribacteraceae bacterium]
MDIKFRGKVVGRIGKDKFITQRREDLHLFRIFNGYGISEEVLDSLPETTRYIRFIVREKTGIWKYTIKREHVKTKGNPWTDRQDDVQFIIAVEDMVREKL